ncbi:MULTISPECIES: S8 family serine peptidase [Microbacterium]|uniref:S53 family peptidase n=1 Tax=Microbacterium TaxID=33882 RepID=UPI00277F8176|nr:MULTISPECIES: S53 family peptidase [Microbacterium]MDQ1085060.1 subtilase family serine protease [Microbacterium sp. SORGH_AS_0344]MDQ1169663.1 subtilase family serine protease [Microbacterium proteolyticum]
MRPQSRRRPTTPLVALVVAALATTTACGSPPPAEQPTTEARRILAATAPAWAAGAADTAHDAHLTASVLLAESAGSTEVAGVRDWLVQNGLTVTGERASIHALTFTGRTSTIARVFDTSFGETLVGGRAAVAPTRDLSVPAGLTVIESVAGLVDTEAMRPTTAAAPERTDDCAEYWGQTLSASWPASVAVEHRSNALCGYGPAQLRAVHELPSDATGAGATVAIVGVFDDDRVAANTDTYFTGQGLPALRAGQYTHEPPAAPDTTRCGGPSAWTVEQHLDVQAVHAVAPDADIVYWGANDCLASTLYLRVLDAVEAPVRPSVVSLSFGGPEDLDTDADRTLLNRVLVEAASRGVSVFASSGNDGDYSLAGDHHDETDVATPASSPYITAVGGASIGLDADDRVEVEAGWEVQTRFAQNGGIIPPGFLYGAGGGESVFSPRPSWQSARIAHAGTGRLVPDVASLADPNTGFTIAVPRGDTLAYEAHGGTSLATPMVASMVAIAKARTGVQVGLAAPYLYDLAGSSAFRDVVPASAGTWYRRAASTGQLWLETLYLWDTRPQSLQSAPGWDPVTGIGIPRGGDFLDRFGAER